MAVRIDKAGQHRFSGQIDQGRFLALEFHDFVAIADGDDFPAFDRDGFGFRLELIDGDDRAAEIDRVSLTRRGMPDRRHRQGHRAERENSGEEGNNGFHEILKRADEQT